MNLQTCFIEPLDVLFLRGNKLFGDPGSYGESLVPPWPSIAAGALRSRLLAEQRHELLRHALTGQRPEPLAGAAYQDHGRDEGHVQGLSATR